MIRISPQEYFSNGDKTIIYLGLIIFGIVACVAITAMAIRGGGKN